MILFKTKDYYRNMAIWYKKGLLQVLQMELEQNCGLNMDLIDHLEKFINTTPCPAPVRIRFTIKDRLLNFKYNVACILADFAKYLKGVG